MVDARPHVAAVKAAINAAMPQWEAYDWGELDGAQLPTIYALVKVSRRFAPADRSGRSGRSGWRIDVRTVGTTPNEARKAAGWVAEALDGVVLTIDGHKSTPVTCQFAEDAEPDSGRYSSDSSWNYAI